MENLYIQIIIVLLLMIFGVVGWFGRRMVSRLDSIDGHLNGYGQRISKIEGHLFNGGD